MVSFLSLVVLNFHRFICQRVARLAAMVGTAAGCRRSAEVAVAAGPVGEVGPGHCCPGCCRLAAVSSVRSEALRRPLLAPEWLAVVRIQERSVPARSADLAD